MGRQLAASRFKGAKRKDAGSTSSRPPEIDQGGFELQLSQCFQSKAMNSVNFWQFLYWHFYLWNISFYLLVVISVSIRLPPFSVVWILSASSEDKWANILWHFTLYIDFAWCYRYDVLIFTMSGKDAVFNGISQFINVLLFIRRHFYDKLTQCWWCGNDITLV